MPTKQKITKYILGFYSSLTLQIEFTVVSFKQRANKLFAVMHPFRSTGLCCVLVSLSKPQWHSQKYIGCVKFFQGGNMVCEACVNCVGAFPPKFSWPMCQGFFENKLQNVNGVRIIVLNNCFLLGKALNFKFSLNFTLL